MEAVGRRLMLSYSGRHMDRAGVSTIAVNGVVYGKRDDMGPGQRVWVEEEPWFLPGHGWYSRSFPVRFEDGMLDWDRLMSAPSKVTSFCTQEAVRCNSPKDFCIP